MSVSAKTIRRVGGPIKRRAVDEWHHREIRKTFAQLGHKNPDLAMMDDLTQAWGNPNFRASSSYLLTVAQEARISEAPILECGSGLSTLVAAYYAKVPVHSLEHIEGWAKRVRRALSRCRLEATVHDAPLEDQDGDYDWYRIPKPFPSQFGLVVCDGPPGRTRGGRRGLIPAMGDRIAGARVALDDTDRDAEAALVRLWSEAFGAKVLDLGDRHALLQLPG